MDQLQCLPDPFTPSNGFSCSRQTSPFASAVRRSVSMIIMLWSTARLISSNIGASSNCAGATSLCRVFAGIPSRQSASSTSVMNLRMRGRIEP